jgi:surfactin synthase thioesterase subunit
MAGDERGGGQSRWIVRTQKSKSPTFRLFCFPHAGGNASCFHSWAELLPHDIEVCAVEFPGRQRRRNEPPYLRMTMLTRSLELELQQYLDVPFALFGNCTGSLVAFELARRLRKRNLPMPSQLFVTCCRAPQLPERGTLLHALPVAILVDQLRRLGGTPPQLLDNPQMIEILLPCLRADFELAETYRYTAGEPFDFQITAIGGYRDDFVEEWEIDAWAEHSRLKLDKHLLDEGHYLVESAQSAIIKILAERIAAPAETIE